MTLLSSPIAAGLLALDITQRASMIQRGVWGVLSKVYDGFLFCFGRAFKRSERCRAVTEHCSYHSIDYANGVSNAKALVQAKKQRHACRADVRLTQKSIKPMQAYRTRQAIRESKKQKIFLQLKQIQLRELARSSINPRPDPHSLLHLPPHTSPSASLSTSSPSS